MEDAKDEYGEQRQWAISHDISRPPSRPFNFSDFLYEFGLFLVPELLQIVISYTGYVESPMRLSTHCFQRKGKMWQDKPNCGSFVTFVGVCGLGPSPSSEETRQGGFLTGTDLAVVDHPLINTHQWFDPTNVLRDRSGFVVVGGGSVDLLLYIYGGGRSLDNCTSMCERVVFCRYRSVCFCANCGGLPCLQLIWLTEKNEVRVMHMILPFWQRRIVIRTREERFDFLRLF